MSFAGFWTPAHVPYPQGAIVLRQLCTPAMWATPPSCNQGNAGPFFCSAPLGCLNADPVNGDPIVNNFDAGTGEWTRIGDAPAGFVPAQNFNSAISTMLSNPQIVVDADGGLNFATCFAFNTPLGGAGFPSGQTSPGCYLPGAYGGVIGQSVIGTATGTGFGTAPSAGTYTHMTVTLAAPYQGAATQGAIQSTTNQFGVTNPVPNPCSSSCQIDQPLQIVIAEGPGIPANNSFNLPFNCALPVGATQTTCTGSMTVTSGDPLGFMVWAHAQIPSTTALALFTLPNMTVTLTQ
jgi:hypothetical protein